MEHIICILFSYVQMEDRQAGASRFLALCEYLPNNRSWEWGVVCLTERFLGTILGFALGLLCAMLSCSRLCKRSFLQCPSRPKVSPMSIKTQRVYNVLQDSTYLQCRSRPNISIMSFKTQHFDNVVQDPKFLQYPSRPNISAMSFKTQNLYNDL